MLYHAEVLVDAKRYQEAIDKLEQESAGILDQKAKDQLIARCLLALKMDEEAAKVYRSLLDRNSNAHDYIDGYLAAKGISASAGKRPEAEAVSVFEELEKAYPQSAAVRRSAMHHLNGLEFNKRLDSYIVRSCQKGIPSLFSSMKLLYPDADKRQAIEETAERYRQEWEPREAGEAAEPPTTYLWCLYLLAQHYSFTGRQERALAYIDSALAHTPTMPELHMTRARILKRAGDLLGAAHAADDARILDGQDRYLNCKAVKYALRVDDVEGAVKMAGLFTKPDAASPVADLVEMQALWFLPEEAEAHFRAGNWPVALKRLSQIDAIIDEMWQDQIDFHSYCIRKYTLRAYVNSVQWEDDLHKQPQYIRSANKMIDLCLRIHDQPELKKTPAETRKGRLNGLLNRTGVVLANGSAQTNGTASTSDAVNGSAAPEEPKKSNKQKKAEARAKAEAARRAAADAGSSKADAKDDDEVIQPAKDEDPDGVKQLAELQPLELIAKLLQELQKAVPERIETWLSTLEWALREKNWLAAARALSHAHALDATHPDVHCGLIRLKKAMPDLDAAPEPVRDSIAVTLPNLIPDDISLEAFNAQYLQQHGQVATRVLGAARALQYMSPTRENEVAEILLRLPKLQASLETLVDGLTMLRGSTALAEYTQACKAIYPHANDFKTDAELADEAKARHEFRQSWDALPDEDAVPKA